MSSDVEEYQEVVDKYFYAPEKNIVAEARQLAKVQYSSELIQIQRKEKDEFNAMLTKVSGGALYEITKTMAETLQIKMNKINLEMKRMKDLFRLNRQKIKTNKADLRIKMKEIQQDELKRTHQLDTFVDYVATKEFKHIMFKCWVTYRNARKFRKEIQNFCQKYRTRRLQDKVFHEWKYMISKWGIEMRLKKKYEYDLNYYKEEHLHVIALLQENIKHVEEEILRKRQARKEFSFNLSRNLLKTISNLSMEVVSLNQYAIKDKEMANELESANILIKQKLKELENIKITITLEEEEEKKEMQNKSGIFSTNIVKSSFVGNQ